jgi:hypothetical protein
LELARRMFCDYHRTANSLLNSLSYFNEMSGSSGTQTKLN